MFQIFLDNFYVFIWNTLNTIKFALWLACFCTTLISLFIYFKDKVVWCWTVNLLFYLIAEIRLFNLILYKIILLKRREKSRTHFFAASNQPLRECRSLASEINERKSSLPPWFASIQTRCQLLFPAIFAHLNIFLYKYLRRCEAAGSTVWFAFPGGRWVL